MSIKYVFCFVLFSEGFVGKTNIPSISTVRSVQYQSTNMKVFKASNIGDGISIPYKKIDFEANMRLTSPFTVSINEKQYNLAMNR